MLFKWFRQNIFHQLIDAEQDLKPIDGIEIRNFCLIFIDASELVSIWQVEINLCLFEQLLKLEILEFGQLRKIIQ